MPMKSSDDHLRELFQQFEADLQSLLKLVFTYRRPVAESDVRLASVVLRKWLLDGLLGRLAKAGGWVPTFYALDNAGALDAIRSQPSIKYFLTGGVRFNGIPMCYIYDSSLTIGRITIDTR
jgi:hypothetical protein